MEFILFFHSFIHAPTGSLLFLSTILHFPVPGLMDHFFVLETDVIFSYFIIQQRTLHLPSCPWTSFRPRRPRWWCVGVAWWAPLSSTTLPCWAGARMLSCWSRESEHHLLCNAVYWAIYYLSQPLFSSSNSFTLQLYGCR